MAKINTLKVVFTTTPKQLPAPFLGVVFAECYDPVSMGRFQIFIKLVIHKTTETMKKVSFILIAAALFTSCTTEDVAPNYSGSYVAPKMCLTSNFEVTVEQIEGTEHKIFGIYTVDIVNGSFEGSFNNGATHSGTFSDDGKTLIYTQTLNGTSCVGSCVKQ